MHGRAIGQTVKNDIHQFCADTVCSLEEHISMDDRDEWQKVFQTIPFYQHNLSMMMMMTMMNIFCDSSNFI